VGCKNHGLSGTDAKVILDLMKILLLHEMSRVRTPTVVNEYASVRKVE
jgi:hypothetical protein